MENISPNLLQTLRETMERRQVKTPKLSEITGIPKDRIYKWYQEGTHPKHEDASILWKWINGGGMDNVPHETPKDQAGEVYRDKYISTLENQNSFLQRIMESNLSLLAKGQNMIQAQVKTVLQYQALVVGKGDPKKQEAELLKVNTIFAQNVAQLTETGNDGPGI